MAHILKIQKKIPLKNKKIGYIISYILIPSLIVESFINRLKQTHVQLTQPHI